MSALRPVLCFAALLLAASTAGLLGQQTSPAMPAVVLQTNANLVLVDVVVKQDKKPIHGLSKEDFHLIEDGHEQPITTFEEHIPSDATPATIRPLLPLNTYTNVPQYPPLTAVNVLLLDGLNTPLVNQMDVRRKMIEYMGKIKPGTSLAIFTLSSRLRLISSFTTDVPRLIHALQASKSNPQPSAILEADMTDTLSTASDNLTEMGANPDVIAYLQQFAADLTAYQTDLRVRMTMDAMQQLARYLSAIPGRKNLIWFSGSFPIALDPDTTLPSPFSAARTYADQIRETSELLSASRVAVYPVDARGLMGLASTDVSSPSPSNLTGGGLAINQANINRSSGVPTPSIARKDLRFLQQTANEQASMKEIAEQTGGQEYINTNGLREAVAKAIENGSSYYTLGYVPAARQPDGKFHKIEVRTGNGYSLAYRRGYYADAAGVSSAQSPAKTNLILAATMPGAPPASEVRFQARVLPATDPAFKAVHFPDGPVGEMAKEIKGPTQRYIVDLQIDPQSLSFTEAPLGARQASLEFILVAYNAEIRRVNFSDQSFQFNFKDDPLNRPKSSTLPARLALDLPAGQFALRIAIHDLAVDRVGSLEVPLLVPTKK